MRRRMFRYRLSTLLLIFTLVAVYLGMEANRVAKQKEALKIIQSVGGYASFDYQYDSLHKRKKQAGKLTTPGPVWLHNLVGEDYFRTVVSISFEHTTRIGDQHFGMLSKLLPNVRSLWMRNTQITDNGLCHLVNFSQLEKLNLDDNNIGNEGMQYVGQCTRLRSLSLCETNVTDTGIEHLGNLSNLSTIFLADTNVTDYGIELLINASPKKLRWLNLCNTKVTDVTCEQLITLTTLNYLIVQKTYVSVDGAAKIRTNFPKCRVVLNNDDAELNLHWLLSDPYRPD